MMTVKTAVIDIQYFLAMIGLAFDLGRLFHPSVTNQTSQICFEFPDGENFLRRAPARHGPDSDSLRPTKEVLTYQQ